MSGSTPSQGAAEAPLCRDPTESSLDVLRVSVESHLSSLPQTTGGETTSPDWALCERLQLEIQDEGRSLYGKAAWVLFQLLESGLGVPDEGAKTLGHILDAAIAQNDFATATAIGHKLRILQGQPSAATDLKTLYQTYVTQMGAFVRLMQVEEALKGRTANGPDIVRYVQSLSPQALGDVLGILERIEMSENRALVADALVPLAKLEPDRFVARLSSDRPQTVRDMLHILDRSGHPERMSLLAQGLKHRSMLVRMEALQILARSHTPEIRNLVASGLTDDSGPVRMLAARLLPQFDRERALGDLIRLIEERSFGLRPDEEQIAIFRALGSTALPKAIALCEQILRQRPTLLNRQRVIDEKRLALHGLIGACNSQAIQLLEDVASDTEQPDEVSEAARAALDTIQQTILGNTSQVKELV